MAAPRILTDAQHRRYYDIYMKEARSPMECASILMAEFEDEGLQVTPKQLSTYAYERKWSSRKKALLSKAERKASRMVNQMAENLAKQKLGLAEQHKTFLEKQATVGAKALEKAERLVETAPNARDLSSAVNAAAKGAEMFRRAVGLDGEKGSLGGAGNTFVFNFARGEESPFAKQVINVQAEEIDDQDDGDDQSEENAEQSDDSSREATNTLQDPHQSSLNNSDQLTLDLDVPVSQVA